MERHCSKAGLRYEWVDLCWFELIARNVIDRLESTATSPPISTSSGPPEPTNSGYQRPRIALVGVEKTALAARLCNPEGLRFRRFRHITLLRSANDVIWFILETRYKSTMDTVVRLAFRFSESHNVVLSFLFDLQS